MSFSAPSVDTVRTMSSAALQDRIETLLERYRGSQESPTQQEINDLYTDGCAAVMMLDTERLRVKRRLRAALFDSATDPEAAAEAQALARENQELVDELERLNKVVRQLRAAVDWAQDERTYVAPRRPRFDRTESAAR